MPGRLVPLVTNEIYHVFNRGIDRRPTFTTKREYERALTCLKFYIHARPPLRLSKFLRLEEERRNELRINLLQGQKLVRLLSLCLMPNHFHLLLEQATDGGISKFLSNFQNSYTRYYNVRHNRDGSLFLDQFKAVRIESEEQLIHVSRYIHINPYTSFVVKNYQDLVTYPWSSLSNYLNNDPGLVETGVVMAHFANPSAYKRFVLDQANYQRTLKEIENLTFT